MDKTRIFYPMGSEQRINELRNLLVSLKENTKRFSFEKPEKLEKEIQSYIDEYERKCKELLDFIKAKWGKYLKFKLYYQPIKGKDEKWLLKDEINGMVYRYIHTNDCLFGIFSFINDTYRGGVNDSRFNLLTAASNYKLEISEITKEQFLEESEKSMHNCLKYRNEKIKNYKLDEWGYVFNLGPATGLIADA